MALLRPREITQIVRVGLGFEACFSWALGYLCPCAQSSHLLSQGLGTWGLSDFLGYPGHGFFFLSYTFASSCHLLTPPDADRQSRRESALSVSLNTSWEASQSIVSFCFLVIHLSSMSPPAPPHPLQIPCHSPSPHSSSESEDGGLVIECQRK